MGPRRRTSGGKAEKCQGQVSTSPHPPCQEQQASRDSLTGTVPWPQGLVGLGKLRACASAPQQARAERSSTPGALQEQDGATGQPLDGAEGPNKWGGRLQESPMGTPSALSHPLGSHRRGGLVGRRLSFYYKRQTTASLFLGALP